MTTPSLEKASGPPATGGPVLSVRGLTVSSPEHVLLHPTDLDLAPGERVGLIGESGSGKSMTALSVMGLLPEELTADGSVRLAGVPVDLLDADDRTLSRVRGRRVSMVFQEPMTALNPLMRVGDQVAETMRVHGTRDRAGARARALQLLADVRLPDPERTARAWPHQLSGGQRQRVVLAMALANDPDVLVCDEPTTALDVTVQDQVLGLVDEAVRERGAALLFITHDLSVVARTCDRVLVMYGGRVVESGPVLQVLTAPRHPYTRGLLESSDLGRTGADGRLATIPGSVPGAGRFPAGCVFRTRCSRADAACSELPPLTGRRDHGFSCHHPHPEEAPDAR